MKSHLVFGIFLGIGAAVSQTTLPGDRKEVAFEVLSIRPTVDGLMPNMNTRPSPNGFDSRLSFWQAVMVAYGPSNFVNWGSVEVRNAPSWAGTFYDIKGRVSASDLYAWQHQTSDRELLRSAMRAALRDRFKLALHEAPAKAAIFELVVAKRGALLRPATSEPPPPSGIPSPGVKVASGGTMVQSQENGIQVKHFHGATIQDLADFLCIMSGRIPVRDKTGLSGRYDFVIRQELPLTEDNHVYSYPIKHLGLALKTGTEIRPILVIDHAEKPSEN